MDLVAALQMPFSILKKGHVMVVSQRIVHRWRRRGCVVVTPHAHLLERRSDDVELFFKYTIGERMAEINTLNGVFLGYSP